MSESERIILITGGTRGIGRAIAFRFARERPAHIVLGYCMNHTAAREAVAAIEALGVAASAVSTDVGRPELLRELFEGVRARFGRLDVFISNAARASFRPALDLTERAWQKMMDMNAYAFLHGAQLAAALMKERRAGKIVGLSSLGSIYAIPGYAGLGAAKAAIESLTRYLAAELAPIGINVNTVSGGFVDTESMRLNPDYDRLVAYVKSRTPAGRLADAEDVAGVVTFLCSEDARWIQGQTVIADGGMSLVL
jgi:enoyl-[acyl-carrier protein] reductase III